MLACGVSCGKCRCWLPFTPPPLPISACGSGSLLWASLFDILLPNRMSESSSTDLLPSRMSARRFLNLAQVGDAIREAAPVRRRVERLVDVQVRIRPHARLLDHLHRRDARAIG